jgi:hypothetical protein
MMEQKRIALIKQNRVIVVSSSKWASKPVIGEPKTDETVRSQKGYRILRRI